MRLPGHAPPPFVLLAMAAAALAAAACERAPEPVGRLRASPSEVELPYPRYVDLEFSFEPLSALHGLEGTPYVFVHLLEEPGVVLRTFDHPLPGDWEPRRALTYRVRLYQSALGVPLPPGTYPLSAGLYDRAGRRWPLAVEGADAPAAELDRHEYRVATVRVPEPADGDPLFYFSGGWRETAGGSDLQIVGRRWLAEKGTLRLAGARGAGVVWMMVAIPDPGRADPPMTFDPGAQVPQVTVAATCGGVEACVSGPGRHEVELPLRGGQGSAADDCTISIEPNFRMIEPAPALVRSVLLENLAWGPASAE